MSLLTFSLNTLSRRAIWRAAAAGLWLALALPVAATQFSPNFKGTELEEFINIVGKSLGKTIIVDPTIRGKVNVRSYDLLDEKQYYQFFLNVLEVYGYAVVEMDNNVLKVIKSKDAKAAAIPVVNDDSGAGDEFITRVVPVRNVSVRDLAPLLRQLNDNAGGGNVVHYDPSNVIMVTGRAAVVNRLVEIVRLVDKAGDQEVEIVRLQFASAAELVRIVDSLIRQQGKQDATPEFFKPKVVADERINAVLVSGEPQARARVIDLIRRLDSELESTGNTRVFYLKYAKAPDMVTVLKGVSQTIAQDKGGVTTQGQAATRGSAGRTDISIEAHEGSNSLVITAQPDMMRSLEGVIRQLDIRRAQVLVEAMIVEVLEGDGLNFGVQWISPEYGIQQWQGTGQAPVSQLWAGQKDAQDVKGSSILNSEGELITQNPDTAGDYTLLASVLGSINGVMVGMIKDDWAAVVQAVKTSTNSNILATPSITTLDNQEAYFIVGQEVPILTGSTASSSNSNPFQTISRQEVGVKLKVTPQINEGNAVQMEIEQEVSGIAGATAVDITINKRQMKTTVMADDGGTVVLGGLIDEDAQESVSKVPLLGDIPLLGELFTSTNSSKKKRNLMVFIRPSIVRDEATMSYLSERKYNYIRAYQLQKEQQDIRFMPQTGPVLPEYGQSVDGSAPIPPELKAKPLSQSQEQP
ncbi:MAG: type II secretion system secretin GspD [Gammaproteobacteria bacterium]|nr:type II secretion system secretin GspD [Gammaproteobacteria bacterium]